MTAPNCSQMPILSTDTGLADMVTMRASLLSISYQSFRRMVTSSEKVAARLNKRFGDAGQYYIPCRSRVARHHLSHWEKASTISAHTRNYLAENETTIH